MNPETARKTLAYVQASTALAKRALDERNVLTQDREKAASGREVLINEMIAAEAISEGQQEKVATMLATHSDTTALLKSAIGKIKELSANQKQAGDELGHGVSDDISGVTPTVHNENYIGEKTAAEKPSDRAMLGGLGLPVASDG